MKKLLILAMSCNDPEFVKQEQIIRETYAKDVINNKYNGNVSYYSYASSPDSKYHIKESLHRIEVPADDSLMGTYEKTYKVFSILNKLNIEYDFVLRTNCSTYVNVDKVLEYIQQLDENRVYTGGIYCSNTGAGPEEWCFYGVGNSLLLSRYWVSVLINNHISSLIQYNNVQNDVIGKVDDNTIGTVINIYQYIHKKDMFGIWENILCPQMNTIPDNPEQYLIIPVRNYGKNREYEHKSMVTVHDKVKQSNNAKVLDKKDMVHIINFTKGMRSIVSREFANNFVEVTNVIQYRKKHF